MATELKVGQVRMIMNVKRKESLTFEEFSKHWREIHGPLFIEAPFTKEHLISYEQFHTGPQRASVEKALRYPTTGWDGTAVCVFDSLEGMKKVFSSKYMSTVLMADNKKFISKTGSTLFYGEPHVLKRKEKANL